MENNEPQVEETAQENETSQEVKTEETNGTLNNESEEVKSE